MVLLLDTKYRVTGIHTVTAGTLDASLVHPREILKAASLSIAPSILPAHHDSSGDPTPSAEDRSVTRPLVDAGVVLDVEVRDHLALGDSPRFYGFREKGEIGSGSSATWST